ncbi:MAG: cytochrome c biogenesis protein [Anaerolineales bacterium]|nr:cytochrome c biogenesis protein [Anaerolineales bacterium]
MNEKPNLLTILDVVAGLMILVAAGLVFFYVPVEVMMGSVQKVFYFHVATAWVGMLGFLVAAIAGVVYLRKGNLLWDIAGNGAVEISLIFFLTAIVLGSIWARPIWNTWWTWEPRLTTAAIVELIYAAYLLLRQGVDDPERRARFSAIYAIFGFFSVPLTFISIRMLRTIHPVVIGSAEAASQGGFNMDSPMKLTFFFSLAAFTVFFADLLWHRIRLGQLRAEVDVLRIDSYSKGE